MRSCCWPWTDPDPSSHGKKSFQGGPTVSYDPQEEDDRATGATVKRILPTVPYRSASHRSFPSASRRLVVQASMQSSSYPNTSSLGNYDHDHPSISNCVWTRLGWMAWKFSCRRCNSNTERIYASWQPRTNVVVSAHWLQKTESMPCTYSPHWP